MGAGATQLAQQELGPKKGVRGIVCTGIWKHREDTTTAVEKPQDQGKKEETNSVSSLVLPSSFLPLPPIGQSPLAMDPGKCSPCDTGPREEGKNLKEKRHLTLGPKI